jgi:pimeloyl-ACP methyl ester carboxylesterase
LEEHALGVRALVEALPRRGPDRRIVLLGHGMGALTAARVAAMRAEDVVHLVLEEPSRTAVRGRRSHKDLWTWLVRRQAEGWGERLAYAAESYPGWSEEDREIWARGTAQVDPAHLTVPLDWGEPLGPLLTGVRCPVTIVHGRRDRGGIVGPAAAHRCAAACPGGGEVIGLARAGHHPRREAGDLFCALLGEVLESSGPEDLGDGSVGRTG